MRLVRPAFAIAAVLRPLFALQDLFAAMEEPLADGNSRVHSLTRGLRSRARRLQPREGRLRHGKCALQTSGRALPGRVFSFQKWQFDDGKGRLREPWRTSRLISFQGAYCFLETLRFSANTPRAINAIDTQQPPGKFAGLHQTSSGVFVCPESWESRLFTTTARRR